MATRTGLVLVLILLTATGCLSTSRGPGPLAMLPPAPLDDTPRPKAVAAPRGAPGPVLSTAAELPKKLNGQEESTYTFPIPPAPPPTPAPPKVDLPPPPTPTPAKVEPPMPLAPLPLSPNPSVAPALSLELPPQSTAPSLAPPVAVEAKPMVQLRAPSVLAAPVISSPSQSSPLPTMCLETSDPGDNPVGRLRSLHDKAGQRYATMDSYMLRMRRREVVAGKARPEELILAKFRRQPFSLYLKWVGEESKGREVCYVKGQHDDQVHTLMAAGDLFLFAGKHFKVAPDSPLVKSNCRYPITEAGLGPLIARFGRFVTALEKGDSREGAAKLLGKVNRPEFDAPLEGVVQSLPANHENLFPGGGQRFWYFDAVDGLPVLVMAFDHQGKEVEYYCHDRIQSPANLDDDDFNPYHLWKSASR